MTKRILYTANMKNFFKLKPWGPDLQRSWKLLNSLTKEGDALITGLDGHALQVQITQKFIREALQIG